MSNNVEFYVVLSVGVHKSINYVLQELGTFKPSRVLLKVVINICTLSPPSAWPDVFYDYSFVLKKAFQ